MANVVKQFRFYSDNASLNQPSNATKSLLTSGRLFENYRPIIQLGIQTLPGVKFYLNADVLSDPIIIGQTGIYELDLKGDIEISSLTFDGSSIDRISETPEAYLIIDIVYDDGRES